MKFSNHVPVMLKEAVEYLDIKQGQVIVDATFGFGGHARKVLEKTGPGGLLIGFEADKYVYQEVKKDFKQENLILINDNFVNLKANLEKNGVKSVDAIYFDLGISTFHYKESGRGFSFAKDEPLDMRLSGVGPSAADLINGLSEKELANLFYELAQEYKSRQIAKEIVVYRRKNKITSSSELSGIIERAVGRRGRIHPATKVFQALRIAVNNELDNVLTGIEDGLGVLKRGGRILVITFHSGEDRIVKNKFKQLEGDGLLEIITKKPVAPTREECLINPPSRSAKIRVARRV